MTSNVSEKRLKLNTGNDVDDVSTSGLFSMPELGTPT
jgi:hypothetical protein